MKTFRIFLRSVITVFSGATVGALLISNDPTLWKINLSIVLIANSFRIGVVDEDK